MTYVNQAFKEVCLFVAKKIVKHFHIKNLLNFTQFPYKIENFSIKKTIANSNTVQTEFHRCLRNVIFFFVFMCEDRLP